jgi:hypothetical protein
MFWTDYLREVAADFHRLRHRNPRLHAGIIAILALLSWIISWQVIALLASLFSTVGLSISGIVTHKGKLLQHGCISFHGAEANLDQMPLAGAVIVDGRYEVPPSPALKPGRYVTRIWSPRAVPHDGVTTPPAEEAIPPEFNDKSSLIIEVRRFGWNVFNFDLN